MKSHDFLTDSYQTAEGAAAWPYSLLPSLFYYSRMLRIVMRSSRMARTNVYDEEAWAASSREIIAALEKVGVRFSIEGRDHLKQLSGPCVFVGNHMSTLETFVLPGLLVPFTHLTFVIKRSLMEYPVFRHVMATRDPVVVDRTNPREDFKVVMEEGAKRLSAGVSIVVFPQTTREDQFDPAHFNTIGVKLAKRAEVPVIPVALKTDAWSNGRFIKDFGPIRPQKTVHFAFGEPLTVTGNGQQQQAAVVDFIQTKLSQWQD